MRWRGRRQSSNVEDRRGMRVPGGRRGGVSCIGILIVIAIAFYMGWEKPYWAVLVVNYRSSSDGGMKCPSEV